MPKKTFNEVAQWAFSDVRNLQKLIKATDPLTKLPSGWTLSREDSYKLEQVLRTKAKQIITFINARKHVVTAVERLIKGSPPPPPPPWQDKWNWTRGRGKDNWKWILGPGKNDWK